MSVGQAPLHAADSDGGSSLLDKSFDELAQKLLDEYHVPGLSLSIVDKGHVSAKGYGVAQFPSTPATADTLFFAGSTTKAFVAAATAILINDPDKHHNLKWSTPIKDILKEDFVLMNKYATEHTTIEDALSHRSGFPRHDKSYGWTGNASNSVVKTMRYLPTISPFRTNFLYCNLMYAAVSSLVETLEGKNIEEVLHELLWDPLGMKHTSFSLKTGVDRARANPGNVLARGYYWVSDENNSEKPDKSSGYYVPEAYTDLGSIAGAGANISTVKDYALWVKAFLEAAKATDSVSAISPISRKLFEDMTTPRNMIIPPMFPTPEDLPNNYMHPDLYGMAWTTYTTLIPGHIMFGHAGGLTGFGAQVYMMPDHEFGVTTLGNTSLTANIVGELLAMELMGKKVGLSREEREKIIARRRAQCSASEIFNPDGKDREHKNAEVQKALSSNLPLNGDLDSHAGSYFHPAYGTLNFEVASDTYLKELHIIRSGPAKKSAKDGPALFAATMDHVWKYAVVLRHESGQFFNLELMKAHGFLECDPIEGLASGCGGTLSREEKRWAVEGNPVRGGAAFKYGLDDKVVKLGLRMEPEMDALMGEEGDSWEAGLIWFDRADK